MNDREFLLRLKENIEVIKKIEKEISELNIEVNTKLYILRSLISSLESMVKFALEEDEEVKKT